MTTFSIASILGDQNRKLIEQQQQQQDADDNDRDQEGDDDEEEEEGEDTTSSIEEQKQFVFNMTFCTRMPSWLLVSTNSIITKRI